MNPSLSFWKALGTAAVSYFWIAATSSAAPVIAEFMAANTETISDEDGDTSDWIEIFNPDPVPVDLGGYYLTDDATDLTKWQFPAPTSLGSSRYLLVFASDKNRAVSGSELHANFKLTGLGEYLALVAPDGTTIIDEYAPSYPEQFQDTSYGLQQLGDTAVETLVAEVAPCTAHVPTSSVLGLGWTDLAFDDSSWLTGNTGVGYERSSGYESLLGIDIEALMYNMRTTAYVRIPFTVADVSELVGMELKMKYDDGFVAYLNGAKIADDRAPVSPDWNSAATADHSDAQATSFTVFDVGAYLGDLEEGANVLAIHGLNRNTTSSDMLVRAELNATRISSPSLGNEGYLRTPSPGAANGLDLFLPGAEVTISEPSRTFFSSFAVALSGAGDGQTIRYTTDGTPPGAASTEYVDPVSIGSTTQIRARIFGDTGLSGPTATESYIFLEEDLRTFKSNLPIIILDNFSGGRPVDAKTMFMAVIAPDATGDGLAEITDPFQVATRGTMKVRGSSSAGWAKYSMTVEAWDGDDNEQNIEPLGFPSEEDWVLNSKYEFDRALMRNDLAYRLSNDLGEYAVRTQHVEVINNTGGGNMSYAGDYFGVYALMEKIKRDGDRVDVKRLLPGDDAEPEVSGGYLFKKDRLDPGDSGMGVGGMGTMAHVYPKEEEITAAQLSWLQAHLNEFNAAVSAADKTNPDNGKPFTEYIKVDSWLVHHWVNTLAMNVDGFRLSGYYYKDRSGKIGAGPVWDFDRTMESTDGRDNNPLAWDGTGDSSMTWYDGRFTWWGEALEDADFKQLHTDMWQREREPGGVFTFAHIESIIDEFDAGLNESVVNDGEIASTAQQRNFNEWTSKGPRSWTDPDTAQLYSGHDAEVRRLKWWLETRADWIDTQYTAKPSFTEPPGVVAGGSTTSFAGGGGTVYYMVDGSDPRASGGGIAAGALTTLPITLNASMAITARARNGSQWSGPLEGSYLVGPLANANNLVISEVHYAPAAPTSAGELGVSADPADYEFIELVNVSSTDTISLLDVHFEQGVDFTFTGSTITSLAPGERVLVVRNQSAFEARYGTAHSSRIAGDFLNGTALNNDGETLQLVDAFGIDIALFTYNDQLPWPTDAGAPGYSLVLIHGDLSPPADYGDASLWRSSTGLGGNPNSLDRVAFSGNPTDDLDADGLLAILEYGLATSDLDSGSGPGAIVPSFEDIDISGVSGRYMTIRFRRALAADDVVLSAESSTSLSGDWSELGLVLHSETHNGDGTSTVVYRTAATVEGSGADVFCRVVARGR